MQGTRDSFGLPLTVTPMIENKLKTALYIFPQVGAPWLFFFKVREAPYDKRGEQLCTTQVKGTTLDTDEGKQTPKVLCKGPENNKGGGKKKKKCSSMRRLGIFSSTRSAHDSD